MKYQTEYQRNYQKRTPRKFHELPIEERKLSEVSARRSASSPSRRRGRSVPASPDRNNANFAVIGPNEKFSQSQLYRMKEPVKDYPRVAKSQEFALLGKNSKFENNVVYPLRKPVISNSPRVVVRRRKSENHSCGIQTNLKRTTSASFDPRYKRDKASQRKRNTPLSEYKQQYDWKQPATTSLSYQIPNEDVKDERQSNSKVSSSAVERPGKTSVAVNTPARVEIDVNRVSKPAHQAAVARPAKPFRPKRDETTEYRARYKPTVIEPKQPRRQKAFEAEQVDERRKRQEVPHVEQSRSDDEGTGGVVNLGNEFRQKYPHGKLRRWKSEYQSTYKPFWRFDYKDGKWYKDTATDEKGFNPNLFWYKELMSTRKRADEFRSKAETDHFNPDHTLQLQTGYGTNNYQAWDIEDDRDEDSDSVISIDRDLERERIEGERRREKDARRNQAEQIRYEKPKQREKSARCQTDPVVQTDHQVDRVIYVDEPLPKQPSSATKAFVRNLGSSSVQQHMSWDSESLYSQQSNSDIDSYRRHDRTDNSKHRTNIIRRTSPKKRESRGTGTHSPLPSERPQRTITSPHINDRRTHQNGTNAHSIRPATSSHDTCNATGRPSYDSQSYDRRPHTSMNEYCTYPGSRFKDEVTDYYYGGIDYKQQQQNHSYAATPNPSYPNHAQSSDQHYGQTYKTQNKEDDVLSVNSARSLSTSCSLASQTLERAHKNLNKYWDDKSPSSLSSPKKTFNAKH
ncbi:hypothetical protein I4U23_026295 [Adineta vaga]|nr:hypothetical protein I4U23_026295 [Adineta vaga]